MPEHWLTETEIVRLTSHPTEIPEADVITFFTLTESDHRLLATLRGDDNRLGFALQLCTLRYLGFVPADLSQVPSPVIKFLARQLPASPAILRAYGERSQTRTGHLQEIEVHLGFHKASALENSEIERWLREIGQKWREGDLGSVEPRMWKKLDSELKAALAPLHTALSTARDAAKAVRVAMIEEAKALAGAATERDTLTQVKALQAKWQEHAKTLSLLQRDERPLWEQFRAACDAVFAARQDKRKDAVNQKQQGRRELEELCVQLESLASATDQDEQAIRKAARDLADRWRKQRGAPDSALRGIEARFKKAQAAIDATLAERARAQKAAVWTTLAAKEQWCEELEGLARTGAAVDAATAIQEKWAALPALPDAWEKKMLARRDAAVRALTDPAAGADYRTRIEDGSAARREGLLELELAFGLDSPAEFQPQKLALQVRQLRDRFKNAATPAASPAERLVAWCAEPGIADESDRLRIARIFSKASAKA